MENLWTEQTWAIRSIMTYRIYRQQHHGGTVPSFNSKFTYGKGFAGRTTELMSLEFPQVTFNILTDYIVQSKKVQIRTNVKFTSTNVRHECLYKGFCIILKDIKINGESPGAESWRHQFTKFTPLLAWKVKVRKSCYRVNT